MIAGAFAVIMALLVGLFGVAFFTLLGGGADAVSAAATYALIFFPGCMAIWLCNASLSIIRGTGDMQTPAVLLLLVSVISIPLSGGFALHTKQGVAWCWHQDHEQTTPEACNKYRERSFAKTTRTGLKARICSGVVPTLTATRPHNMTLSGSTSSLLLSKRQAALC